MNQIDLKAMAKINLGLDVVGLREDGYHEVRMIMQNVRLFDKIHMQIVNEEGIFIKTNLSFLPINENNLIYKAAKLIIDEFEIRKGVSISLEKRIPVAAGMAGGSADAAATLYGMNSLFRLGLSLEELMERGVKIGADVPYCIMRGTALSEGIGEKLTLLKPVPKAYVLIAKPPISVSTKMVYQALDSKEIVNHPDIDGIRAAIEASDIKAIAKKLGNVLEEVTVSEYPVICDIKNIMKENGALNALMSGSGPTVFGLFEDENAAKVAYKKVKESTLAKQVFLTEFYNPLRDKG